MSLGAWHWTCSHGLSVRASSRRHEDQLAGEPVGEDREGTSSQDLHEKRDQEFLCRGTPQYDASPTEAGVLIPNGGWFSSLLPEPPPQQGQINSQAAHLPLNRFHRDGHY